MKTGSLLKMNTRLTLSILSVFMLLAIAITTTTTTNTPEAFAQFQTGGVDKEGTWYAGEGLKQGDYFSYSMCHINYKECVKFEIDLWIRGEIQVGSETKWLAETVVYDGRNTIVGNMELGKITPEPTGGSDEIKKYRNPFKSSIAWLSAFATAESTQEGKGPKAFKDVSWGKIANIGGEQVMPRELDEINAAGITWETVIVGWRTGGAVSEVWVADEFPFPIKAKTFVHVPEGIPPVEYEFVLLDYKEGITENPFADVVSTNDLSATKGCEEKFDKDTTIKKQTVGSLYQVHVSYGPEEPKEGCNMQLLIKFMKKYDETEFLNQVQFDVFTTDSDLRTTRSIANEEGRQFLYSQSGQYLLDMIVMEKPGVENYVIWVYGTSPEHIVPTDPNDYVQIPITIIENDKLDETETIMNDDSNDVQEMQIPDWVKSNAGWWAEGLIDDDSFVQGIQFLINEKIIQIPAAASQTDNITTTDQANEIPTWVKSNAEWWSQGIIDDNTFVQAIQFLIQSGIMVIS